MKYWAFISYSHTDKDWGDWLHKALETYRVPKRLLQKEWPGEQIPERVFPIFRDREELPVSADLGSHIREALDQSRYLIVICSPRAAQSRWVNEEIKTFKKLGREDRILGFIVDGEPNASDGKSGIASEAECFPESMRYRLGPDQELSRQRTEPIAADARPGRDGRQNAKLKLLAGLLQVSFDDLRQREHERRLRRARVIGAAALVLVGVLSALTIAAVVSARRAAAQKRETQHLLVTSDMSRAQELFGRNRPGEALVFLARAAEVDPEPRSVPAERLWFALSQRSWPLPMSAVMRHNGLISSVCFDAGRLLTASADTTARIWDISSGETLVTMPHPSGVREALFTPDRRFILTTCVDGMARLWDGKSGLLVPNWRIQHQNTINSVAINRSGRWVATGSSDGTIRVSDLNSAVLVAERREPENVHTLFFSPRDETLLLSVCGRTAKLWKVGQREEPLKFEHAAQINCAEFDASRDRVLTASDDGTLSLWNSWNGEQACKSKEAEAIKHAAFSPDGEMVASASGSRVSLWDVHSNPVLKYTFENDDSITAIRFSPDSLLLYVGTAGGKLIARNTRDGEQAGEPIQEEGAITEVDLSPDGTRLAVATGNSTARVWNSPVRFPLGIRLAHRGGIQSVSISGDDRYLLSASDDGAAGVWDLTRMGVPPHLLKHRAPVLAAAFSRDGQYILTGSADATARLWKTAPGESLGEPFKHATTVSQVAFNPDGRSFVTVTETGTAQFWDLSTLQPRQKQMQHGAGVTSIDYNEDGSLFLTAGRDGSVRLWDARNSESVGSPFRCEKEVARARFSPAGNLIVAGARDGVATLWSRAKPDQPVHRFRHKKGITDLAFSGDGRLLATASEDNTAAIWEVSSGRLLGDFLQHADSVTAVVFSPDSRKVASACEDNSVRVWDVATGQPLTERLLHRNAVRCLVFNHNGEQLFSGSRDHTVRCWDVATRLNVPDRKWLVTLARLVSSAHLNEAGTLEHRSLDPSSSLRSRMKGAAGSSGRLTEWFFGDVTQRPLTPYNRETLTDYLEQLRRENSETSQHETAYYSQAGR